MERLTVLTHRIPDAKVGDTITVTVRAFVSKIETDVIDGSGYSPTGEPCPLQGETHTDLIVTGLADVHGA